MSEARGLCVWRPRDCDVRSLGLGRLLACMFFWTAVGATGAYGQTEGLQGTRYYDYGGVSPQALAIYQQGWIEILEYGRWAEAERLYRQALAVDPGFTIARSVLARITRDADERDELYLQVEAERAFLDPDAELILRTYQRTLELFAARETGSVLPAGFREQMAGDAVRDYGAFLAKYPGEWSVRIEYIEWVHALQGAAAALQAIDSLGSMNEAPVSYSYFPAYFYAELGEHTVAATMAQAFARKHMGIETPQPHFLNAYVHFMADDLESAGREISKALALDPRHLLAARLRDQIEARRN